MHIPNTPYVGPKKFLEVNDYYVFSELIHWSAKLWEIASPGKKNLKNVQATLYAANCLESLIKNFKKL